MFGLIVILNPWTRRRYTGGAISYVFVTLPKPFLGHLSCLFWMKFPGGDFSPHSSFKKKMEYNVNISLPRSIVLEFVSKLHAIAFVMASKKYEPESPLWFVRGVNIVNPDRSSTLTCVKKASCTSHYFLARDLACTLRKQLDRSGPIGVTNLLASLVIRQEVL